MFAESTLLACYLLVTQPLWLWSTCPDMPRESNWVHFMQGARPSTLIEDHRIETVEAIADAIDDLIELWPERS
jgi:hypothetical protein